MVEYSCYMTRGPVDSGSVPRRGLKRIVHLNISSDDDTIRECALLTYDRLLDDSEVRDYQLKLIQKGEEICADTVG